MTAHSVTLGLLKGQIGFLGKHFNVVLVAKDTGNLHNLAEEEGVEYRDIDMHREISIGSDFISLLKLYRLFKRERPDIVHANTPKGALLGLLAARMAHVPHRIYNVNGLRFETTTGFLRRLLITMEKMACACATKVIPQSHGVAEVVRRERITSKPLNVILNGSGNGVDTLRFNPELSDIKKEAFNLRDNWEGTDFVFVGRIVGDKGVNELVEAFSRLSAKYPDVRLHLVGPEEPGLDPLLPTTTEKIRKNPRIIIHGRQNDVRPFLGASDVFVLPSYREGFPNVVLEAGAMSLPVIVTDVNGATDVVKSGENGYVIPKYNVDALYDKMERLHTHPEERKYMAAKARPIIIARFSQPDVWKATLDMYLEELRN